VSTGRRPGTSFPRRGAARTLAGPADCIRPQAPSAVGSPARAPLEDDGPVNREHHRWHSPSLGRDMDLLVFGHHGARLLVFPTSMGRYFEWEDRGMMEALGEHIERGWLQLFCVDSVDDESWYAKWKHPHDRAVRQGQYEDYVVREVLPFSQSKNGNPFLIATGASFGAYHAVNMGLRNPHLFNRVLGMSGLYDIREQTDGYYDDAIAAQNPSHYVSLVDDWERLEAMRRMDIILATGRDDSFVGNNEYLSRALWEKGIGNALRLWDGWAHDWPWWRDMVRMYVGGSD
jgi:esterase/lipase superfamily enzyme